MTNEEIIYRGIQAHLGLSDTEASKLLLAGQFPVYHTYDHWKELGYQVRKGEHAEIKLAIWKQGKAKQMEDGSTVAGRMFLKTASFFGRGQVDKVDKVGEVQK